MKRAICLTLIGMVFCMNHAAVAETLFQDTAYVRVYVDDKGIALPSDGEVRPENATARECDAKLFRDIMLRVQRKTDAALWKGSRLATVHSADGKTIRIRLSWYGRFFAIPDQAGYYLVDPKDADAWEKSFVRPEAAERKQKLGAEAKS